MMETVLQTEVEDMRDLVINSGIEQDLTVTAHENSVILKNEFLEFCEINKINPNLFIAVIKKICGGCKIKKLMQR